MPRTSTLGDNRHEPHRPQNAAARAGADVRVTIVHEEEMRCGGYYGRCLTVVACLALIAAGTAVGVWAAVEQVR